MKTKKATVSKSAKKTPKKNTALPAALTKNLTKDIWPLERDLMIRPDRYKYVRKLVKDEGCVFCNAASKKVGFETLCLYQTKHSMVLINKYPYNSGHILVLPKRHCGNLLSLTENEFTDLHRTLKIAMAGVQQVYSPAGFNLGMNHGAVAGAGIPDHLHYHIVPRWAGDVNFFPLIAETKVVIESLEQTFDRLLSYFKGLK